MANNLNTTNDNNTIDILVQVSEGAKFASLSFITSCDDEEFLRGYIYNALSEKGVKYGILDDVVKRVAHDREAVYGLVIAEATEAQNGEDAIYKFYFDREHHIAPKFNEDGSVDYKEMGYVEAVVSGNTLLEKKEATKGVEGIDVLGNTIKPIAGKDINIKAGKNCEYIVEELKYIASCDGAVHFENNILSVADTLEIKEDIGNGTGNISFPGEIKVYGNILAGMFIKCNKLYVKGIVESAIIFVNGDITIDGGIQGNRKTAIVCRGNLKSVYLNNADVFAHGNITADMIINSKVKSDKSIIVEGKKGHIVGGITEAKGRVSAQIIGSPLGVPTKFVLGEKSIMMKEMKELEAEIEYFNMIFKKMGQCLLVLKRKLQIMPKHKRYLGLQKEYHKNLLVTKRELINKKEQLAKMKSRYREISISEFSAYKVYEGVEIDIDGNNVLVDQLKNNYILKSIRGKLISSDRVCV
jgi:uncharacterized protein (DUF342 family)